MSIIFVNKNFVSLHDKRTVKFAKMKHIVYNLIPQRSRSLFMIKV